MKIIKVTSAQVSAARRLVEWSTKPGGKPVSDAVRKLAEAKPLSRATCGPHVRPETAGAVTWIDCPYCGQPRPLDPDSEGDAQVWMKATKDRFAREHPDCTYLDEFTYETGFIARHCVSQANHITRIPGTETNQ